MLAVVSAAAAAGVQVLAKPVPRDNGGGSPSHWWVWLIIALFVVAVLTMVVVRWRGSKR